jgi:DNA-binding transcriptional MerR regulator
MAAGKNHLLALSGEERTELISSSHSETGMDIVAVDKIGELSGRPMVAELTISQMSKQYHVTKRALRFYEDRALLSPRRPSGWRRYYGEKERKRLEMILLGKRLGFSLAEIKEIVNNPNIGDSASFEHLLLERQILEQLEFLERRREEINSAIARLRARLSRRRED